MWATVQMAIQLGLLGLAVAVILQAPKPDASADEIIFVYAHTPNPRCTPTTSIHHVVRCACVRACACVCVCVRARVRVRVRRCVS
jgi:hypothetical protein